MDIWDLRNVIPIVYCSGLSQIEEEEGRKEGRVGCEVRWWNGGLCDDRIGSEVMVRWIRY